MHRNICPKLPDKDTHLVTLTLFQARFVSLQTPKWTLSERLGILGFWTPAWPGQGVAGRGGPLPLCPAQSSLTPSLLHQVRGLPPQEGFPASN